MQKITFVTGNQGKADYMAKHLGFPLAHKKIDLDEIQSLSLKEIVEHKVWQAYTKLKKPVLVEDVSLEFHALGKLPGPFIRFFVDEVPLQDVCDMICRKDRKATARCVFGYYDGKILKMLEGKMDGEIAKKPAGKNGFGWDQIFVPKGYEITRAQMNEVDDKKTYLKIKPITKLKKFFREMERTK